MLAGMVMAMAVANARTGIFVGLDVFDRFVAEAHTRCPKAQVEYLHASGLLDLEEGFLDTLSPAQRRRLDRAVPPAPDGGALSCVDHNGASCEAMTYLKGYRSSGLSQRFVRYACRPGVLRPDDLDLP